MPIPTPIDYAVFLANAEEADIRALAYLASGDTIKTTDLIEASGFQAQGDRLFNAGMLTRFRRSIEVIGDAVYHVFDGRVSPTALNHVAQSAMERVKLSRDVIPVPAP